MAPRQHQKTSAKREEAVELLTDVISNAVPLVRRDQANALLKQLSDLLEHELATPLTSFSEIKQSDLDDIDLLPRPAKLKNNWQAQITQQSMVCQDTSRLEALRVQLIEDEAYASLSTETTTRMLIHNVLVSTVAGMNDRRATRQTGTWVHTAEYSIDPQDFRCHSAANGIRRIGGKCDFVVTKAPKDSVKDFKIDPNKALRSGPLLQHVDWRRHIFVIEAKRGDIDKQLPQALVEAAALCKSRNLTSVKGCITDSRRWLFFVYVKEQGSHFYQVFDTPVMTFSGFNYNAELIIQDLELTGLEHVVATLEHWLLTCDQAGSKYWEK